MKEGFSGILRDSGQGPIGKQGALGEDVGLVGSLRFTVIVFQCQEKRVLGVKLEEFRGLSIPEQAVGRFVLIVEFPQLLLRDLHPRVVVAFLLNPENVFGGLSQVDERLQLRGILFDPQTLLLHRFGDNHVRIDQDAVDALLDVPLFINGERSFF